MRFGLSDSEYTFLMDTLITPLKRHGSRVFIFGSRATGKHKRFSDVDILYKESNPIPSAEIYQLLSQIEESTFSYKVDLVRDEELAQSYRENVERDKIEI